MRLTAEEKELIARKREATASAQAELKQAREDLLALSDEQALQIANQLRAERQRVRGYPGPCKCDSQWTNPKCPRVLAGWSGFDCDIPPAPVAHIKVNI